jgi:hypothetical protein
MIPQALAYLLLFALLAVIVAALFDDNDPRFP